MSNHAVAQVRGDAWIDPLTYDVFGDGAVFIPLISAVVLALVAVAAVVVVTR